MPLSDDGSSSADVLSLRERLVAVQALGRFGVWERDPVSGEGVWDEQMYALWGLPAARGAPRFEQAAAYVLPEDHAQLAPYFVQSLKRPGEYEFAVRLRHPQRGLRHLLSRWWVRHTTQGVPLRVLGLCFDRSEEVEREAQAQARQELWREAAALAGITLWHQDVASGTIVQSEQVEHVLGYRPPPQGLSVAAVRRHLHPDDVPVLLDAVAKAEASTEPVDYEVRYRNEKTGEFRTVLTRRLARRDAHGEVVAHTGISLDVTAARAAERRTTQLRALLESATETAGIGHWRWQEGEAAPFWNAAMREMHQLEAPRPPPLLDEWVHNYVHAHDRARVLEVARSWAAQGSAPLHYEARIQRPDGQLRHLQMHLMRSEPLTGEMGKGRIVFGLAIDVTERRQAESQSIARAERARLAASGVGIGTWEQDFSQPERPLWDETMWRLRGLQPGERVLNAAERLALVHPDDVAAMEQVYQRSMREGGPLEYEFRVRWPDGQWRWLAGRSVAVLDAEGVVQKRIGVNWDVTQSRHLSSLQQERARAVLESQAKSRFLARMSHELRTPLNAVLGFAQMLLDEGDATPPQRRQRRLANIVSAGQHLLSLINDVLDLSTVESGEFQLSLQSVPLGTALMQALPLLEAQARQHGVRLRVQPSEARVRADPTRLRQVLVNLLSNGIKYNRPGGEVVLEVQADEAWVCLHVRDTGMGLDEAQMAQLFQPFNRLGRESGEVGGTGIGLTIVKSLVERMQGSIEVTSRLGEGSCFSVRLRTAEDAQPSDPSAPQHRIQPLPADPAGAASRQRLLYVEDNPVNAMIVSELLAQRQDIELHHAATGEQGVALAKELRPRLVLLDMQLPDISGEEVFARLRADASLAGLPVVALSANAMPADIERALAIGFSDYWTKPLDFRAFRSAIDTLFGPAVR
jgi:PAS domain S-box-containing protein